jgi:hypothetical protein
MPSRSRTSPSPGRAQVLTYAVFVVMFFTIALGTWRNGTVLDERGQPATAQVISVYETTRGVPIATVRFSTADGRTIETQTRPDELVDPPPAVGSTIPVIYDPENPQAEVRDPRAPQENTISPVIVLGAGIAACLGLLLAQIRRWRSRPARTGDAGRASENGTS